MSPSGGTPPVQYVSVMVFTLKPDDFAAFSADLTMFAKRRGPTIPGLVEILILGDDTKNRMVAVAQWDSRESWSAAQWEEDVGRWVAALVETAVSFEVHSYAPVAVVRTE